MTPRLAIIIPIYRHSTLAHEAIDCALSLDGPLPTVVIAVDDGCPHAETRAALEAWSLAEPQRFHRLHQANRGLSGARNTGIDFALSRYPSLEALYPLDADNRLDRHALHLFDHLLRAHPEVDWFYPNFDMFGINANQHNGGPLGLAQLSESNPCEAGSLVRRRVFDTGVRFDETMRGGYEDWEFWLSAVREGFRGMPVRQSFFRYRKRPQSMLAASHDADAGLRQEIQTRHRWLYEKDNVAQFTAQAVPRFVLFEGGEDGRVLRFTDPRRVEQVTRDDALRELVLAAVRPSQTPRPMAWAFARPGVLERLNQAKLGASALWHLHACAMSSDIASLKLGTRADGLQELRVHYPDHYHRDWADWKELELNAPETWHEATGEARASERAHLYDADIALLRAEAVVALSNPAAEQTRGDAQRLASYIDSLRVARIDLALDHESGQPTEGAASPVWSLKQAVVEVLNARADGDYLHRLRPWREQPLVSGPESLHWILSKQNCGALPLPILRNTGDYHIGFVVPIFQFGGVEKCVVSLARSLKRRGVKCHLFVYGDGAMTGVDWLTEPFETIHQFNDWVLRDWNGRNYLGTTMATEPNPTVLRDLVSALTGMDAVIVSGCAAAYYGFSNLRSKGIKTLTYEHLLERDNFGRSFGTPYLAVAYEGGIDRILTCSHQLRDWLHGQGVPWEKLLALPNGPGFPMPSDRIADALRIRQERSSDVPLRVGFLGRFDQQKGADRFVDLVSRCKGLPIKFSITGSAVLDDGGVSIPDFVERHPAAYSCEELEAAFDRLDVLLMPSRDEGLPLTIMEAQRVGVIPVVTDVGAVSEAIEDGENGFLIPGPDVVQQMVLLLNRLVSEPDLRSSLVQGASETEAIWDGNAARLLGFLQPQMLAAS